MESEGPAGPVAQTATRGDLIAAALQEQITQLSGLNAGYRADITLLINENNALHAENADLRGKVEALEYAASLLNAPNSETSSSTPTA